jgi:hypothetical protein
VLVGGIMQICEPFITIGYASHTTQTLQMISYRIVYQPATKIFGGYVFISVIFFLSRTECRMEINDVYGTHFIQSRD